MIRLDRRYAIIMSSLVIFCSCGSNTTEISISNNSETPLNSFIIIISNKEINIGDVPANSNVTQNIDAISTDLYKAKSYLDVSCKWKRPDVAEAFANEHVKTKGPINTHLQKVYIFIEKDNKMVCSINDDNKAELKEVEDIYAAFRGAAGDLLNNVTNTAKKCMSDATVNMTDKDLFAPYWDNAKLWNIVVNRTEYIEGNKNSHRTMYKDRLLLFEDPLTGIKSTTNKTFDGYYMITGYAFMNKQKPLFVAKRKLVPDTSDKTSKAVEVIIMLLR